MVACDLPVARRPIPRDACLVVQRLGIEGSGLREPRATPASHVTRSIERITGLAEPPDGCE